METLTRSDSVSSLESFEDAECALVDEAAVEDTFLLTDLELPDPLTFQNYDYNKNMNVSKYKNGNEYEGKIDEMNFKSGSGTLYDETREQHVHGFWSRDILVLLETAQFKISDNTYVKIYTRNNLIVIDEYNLVARFSIGKIHLKCDSFSLAQVDLYKSIVIEEIYHDELTNKLKVAREQLDAFLNDLVGKASSLSSARQDMFCIYRLQNEVEMLEQSEMNVDLLTKIISYDRASSKLKSNANDVLLMEVNYCDRKNLIPVVRVKEFCWKSVFKKHVQNVLASIEDALISKTPSFVLNAKSDIHNLLPYQLFQIKFEDVQLFSDIELTILQLTYPTDAMKDNFIQFFTAFVADLWTIFMNNFRNNSAQNTGYILPFTKPVFVQLFKAFSDLLIIVLTNTKLDITKIITKDSNAKLKVISNDNYSLLMKNKLKFFVQAIEHFKPGCLNTEKYSYDCKKLVIKEKNWLSKTIDNFWNTNSSIKGIEDDYLIWLYYIHDCFSHMIQNNFYDNSQELLEFLNYLLDKYKLIIQYNRTSFESLRIVSENVVIFARLICRYFKNKSLDNELDLVIEQSRYVLKFNDTVDNYSDLIASVIDTYQSYWELRIQLKKYLFISYTIEPMLSSVLKVLSSITTVLKTSLNMDIYSEKFVDFLRSFNECLKNIHEKDKSSSTKPILELVVNLMECTNNFLRSNYWSADAKMLAASDMVLAMGRSFKHCDQPNYKDIQLYFKATTEPFFGATGNSSTYEEFRKRVEMLDNFYADTNNKTVMSLNMTLDLCEQYSREITQGINYQFDKLKFKRIYDAYETRFNHYIEQSCNNPRNVQAIVDEIKNQITATKINEWDDTYKTTLPNILAGISAVWSIHFKIQPYCTQIICILRLLGADQSDNGFENHLAQVQTGQGKSVILALLSTVLALTSNKVRVVCHNKYLAHRDRDEFQSFFELFGVENGITYGTFEDMAIEVINPRINKKSGLLMKKNFIGNYFDTILIIDETDVLFSPDYFGNKYNTYEIIFTKTFTIIQSNIWKMTLENVTNDNIIAWVNDYIKDIKTNNDDNIFLNIYTKFANFLKQSIRIMVKNAKEIKNRTSNDWFIERFSLDNNGDLVYRENDGQYSKTTYYEYYNIFIYLKLKKLDGYIIPSDLKGYLYLSTSIYYALLSNEYILGVTGTLTTLSSAEIGYVNMYKITRGSNMPALYGSGKLNNLGFKMAPTELYWEQEIFDSVMKIVKDKRAVIVFFDLENQIYKMKPKFEENVKCVAALTGNEEKNKMEKLIDRVPRSVTLTTRRMGRGVDFKSKYSHLEDNGGVHVIQTFFCADLNEEIQIKGRTARNMNQGSYELILCYPHVKQAGFDCKLNDSYNDLNILRANKTSINKAVLAKKIEVSRGQDDLAMDLIQSLRNDNS